jgi:transketolase
MDAARRGELEKIALEIRKDVVRMLGVARAGGFRRAAAIADVLVYLYWECLRSLPEDRGRADRDRFVLGSGDAVPALYACLARLGFFSRDELWSYSRLGAMLQGYPDLRTPGVDAPWCSGGGLGIACGLAASLAPLGAARVFCLAGEDEMAAGAFWEAAASAPPEGLGNLVMFAGCRGRAGTAAGCLKSLGWAVSEADGSDYDSMEAAAGGMDWKSRGPKAVVLRIREEGMANYGFEEGDALMSRDDVDKVISLLEEGDQASAR